MTCPIMVVTFRATQDRSRFALPPKNRYYQDRNGLTIHSLYTPGEESSIDDLFESAVSEENYGEVLDRLRRSWPAMIAEQGAALRALLDRLPAEQWDHDPWLVAAYGASFRSIGSTTRSAALPYFAAADAITTDDTPLGIRVAIKLHHSAALRSLGLLDEALIAVKQASELGEPDTTMPLAWRIRFRAKIALQRGIVNYHLGEYDSAVADLRLADGLAMANLFRSEQVECFGTRALLEYWMGDFTRATRLIRQTRDAADDSGLLESHFGASALIADALVAVECDDTERALALAPLVAEAAARSDWEPLGIYSAAAMSFTTQSNAEGLELLRRCLQSYRHWHPRGAIVTASEGLRAMLLMRTGQWDMAWDVLGSLEPTQHHASCPARFIAYLRFLNGDYAGALAAIKGCEVLGDAHSARTLIDVLVLKAVASYQLGDVMTADAATDRALMLAAHSGTRVALRMVPDVILRQMRERAASRSQPDEVRAILDDLQGSSSDEHSSGVPLLSEREREIVRALMNSPSVSGISDELFISVNTVKSHLKNIYRKLGVSSRREAVKRARELGLQL